MNSIMRARQGLLVGALEGVLPARAKRTDKGLRGDILSCAVACAVQSLGTTAFPVTGAISNAQTTIAPQFAFGAKLMRRLDVGGEPRRPNEAHARDGAWHSVTKAGPWRGTWQWRGLFRVTSIQARV